MLFISTVIMIEFGKFSYSILDQELSPLSGNAISLNVTNSLVSFIPTNSTQIRVTYIKSEYMSEHYLSRNKIKVLEKKILPLGNSVLPEFDKVLDLSVMPLRTNLLSFDTDSQLSILESHIQIFVPENHKFEAISILC